MTNMKRSLSDSDSDDCYDDMKMSPSQSMSDRKKRRGVIEKRRRDRINNSLAELRRLVPAAFEKQGSAKLEKAEILQMTVDHLKLLHQKGLNGYNYDHAALAMDYRSVGFRECSAEIARYLVTVEGMDIQDPLRLRLMSHLQCFSAQRDVASKSLSTNSWNSMGSHHQYSSNSLSNLSHHPSSVIPHHHQTDHSMTHHSSLTAGLAQPGLPHSSHPTTDTSRLAQPPHHTDSQNPSMAMRLATGSVPTQVSSVSTASSQSMLSGLSQVHSQFLNMNPMLSPSGAHSYNTTSSSGLSQLGQSAVKPYRPWGTELAY